MSSAVVDYIERDAVVATVQHYIDGGTSGKSADMRPAFHSDATIYGYVGPDLLAGSIQGLFEWVDGNEPASGLQARFAAVEIFDSVAAVRLELDNWSGHRFTDLLTLLKVDGEWKIVSKAFHLHA